MKTRVKKILGKKVLIPLAAILLLIAVLAVYRKSTPIEKISEFGKYQGYSQELYDGSKRTSDYLTRSDCVKVDSRVISTGSVLNTRESARA